MKVKQLNTINYMKKNRDIKQPYEWTVEGRFEQKEEIFLICELDEGYNGD